MDPGLCFGTTLRKTSELDVSTCRASTLSTWLIAGGAEGGGGGTLGLNEVVENAKLLRSGSLGDSYAFGIAGTGGTSSSSSPPAELCTFRGLGVGRRELDRRGVDRMGIAEPLGFREFTLELDERDMPEAYDLRFCSGVARADDGVTLLPKRTAGDWLKARSSNNESP
jgi:hypothetical protein